MLNFSGVSNASEWYIRTDDMAGVEKKSMSTEEFVEAAFSEHPKKDYSNSDDPQVKAYKYAHPPPSFAESWVVGIVMDI